MPERTKDGKWKWGNIKRNSRKELSQTVYGIWKGNGSKGSFSKFYHEGNPYGAKYRKDHKKHIKESYQLNPLFEGADFFSRPLFSKANVSYDEVFSIIQKLKSEMNNSVHTPKYRKLLEKKYWQFRLLRVKMRRKGIMEVPLDLIERISGSN